MADWIETDHHSERKVSWWDNVKDFAYRHAPERVQGWLDERAMVRDATEEYALYEARVKSGFYNEPLAGDTSEREHALGAIENSRVWPHWNAGVDPVAKYVSDAGQPPRTARGWMANDQNQAAENRRAGDLFAARSYLARARTDRVALTDASPLVPAELHAPSPTETGVVYLEPESSTRLYRVGPLPVDASKTVPGWLRDYEEKTGIGSNLGRWFTADEARAETFRQDHPAWPMVHVDVPSHLASQWRADANPTLLRYTDHPKLDHFVPRAVANTATRTFSERLTIPTPPGHNPTQTVDYVETHRYHDKHFRQAPIVRSPEPDSRQHSWGWER